MESNKGFFKLYKAVESKTQIINGSKKIDYTL